MTPLSFSESFAYQTQTKWLSPEGIYYTGGEWTKATSRAFGTILEVKLKSPFGFKSERSFDELFLLANKYSDWWISIHTDPRWGGSWDMIKEARKRTDKCILAKGIHSSDRDVDTALLCGANAVLVVDRIPCKSVLPHTWLEPANFSPEELEDRGVPIVLNQRNLNNGSRRNIPKICDVNPDFDRKVIAASFITYEWWTQPHGADGCLIGENMESYCKFHELTRTEQAVILNKDYENYQSRKNC
jgi:hypothetical protein